MTSPKAVVTGGAGFIGSHVVDLLVAEGYRVTVIDDLSTGDRANINPAAELVELDVSAEKGWDRPLEGADVVFHLAALPRIQPSFDDPLTHERVNVIGVVNCVLACRDAGVRRLVYSSSSAAYGDPARLPTPEDEPIAPLSPYALQKYAGERYALLLGERYGVETVALRYFNVYGPRSFSERNPYSAYSSVVGIFSRCAELGDTLQITGDGRQERDFVYVGDVARANLAATRSGPAFSVYNVGAGARTSILDLALLFNAPYEHVTERAGEARVTHADISLIRRELGWEPQVDLTEGIRRLGEAP